MKVEFYKHSLTEEDIAAASEAMRGTFLSSGPKVKEFEEAFAKYLNVKHVLAVNSCTSALHLSMVASHKNWKVSRFNEVITTPLTFAATINAILYAGLKPILVDVNPRTGNIDLNQVESAINGKTHAILPVHLYGNMCNMQLLSKMCSNDGIYLIEDAAHCVEGQVDFTYPGQLGDFACFSFYATKNLTCGEGGAIATNNENSYDYLKLLRTHGMSKSAADRFGKSYAHWDITELGYKYNMTDFQAALLLGQLPRLEAQLARRKEIYLQYISGLAPLGITFTYIPENVRSAHHLFTIHVDPARRDDIIVKLNEAGISVTVNYRPIHTLSYYKEVLPYNVGDFPHAERIGASTISLPFYPLLRSEEVQYVIDTLKRII